MAKRRGLDGLVDDLLDRVADRVADYIIAMQQDDAPAAPASPPIAARATKRVTRNDAAAAYDELAEQGAMKP